MDQDVKRVVYLYVAASLKRLVLPEDDMERIRLEGLVERLSLQLGRMDKAKVQEVLDHIDKIGEEKFRDEYRTWRKEQLK